MSEKWQSNVTDFSNIDKEKALFLFNQGEKELQATINLSNFIQDKSLKILASLITLLTLVSSGLIGVFYSSSIEIKPIVFTTLLIFSLFLIVAIYKCKRILSLRKYQFLGNQPKNLWLKDWINQKIEILIMTESESYQSGITNNRICNEERAKLMMDVINIAFYAPIISFGFWLLLTIFFQITNFNCVSH